MPDRFQRYNLMWPYGVSPLKIEMNMVRKGGRWKKNDGGMAGEGMFFHMQEFQKLLWPEKVWHKWSILELESYLDYRTVVVIGPASSGKTFDVATNVLSDWLIWAECTTAIFCSTTRERLED